VTAPAVDATAGTWHDQAPAVAAEAASRLRLTAQDPDRGRLEGQARAAMRAIDNRLDLRPATARMSYPLGDADVVWTYPAGGAPPDVVESAVQVAIDLLRRKDAPFGVLNAPSLSGEPVRISRDQLAGVELLLLPYVEGWGFA
jgi:hypothetical protein